MKSESQSATPFMGDAGSGSIADAGSTIVRHPNSAFRELQIGRHPLPDQRRPELNILRMYQNSKATLANRVSAAATC